eukprot:gene9589-9751_t
MERFKTCEKEAKMKQFSKAALGQFEYEMEELQAGLKKKAKPPAKLVQ